MMEQLAHERLMDNLTRLKLFRAVEVMDDILTASQQSGGRHLSFLDRILEEEVAARDRRRVSTAMKTAGLSMAKTIEGYDFSFHPHLDKRSVMELFDMTFLAKQENGSSLFGVGTGFQYTLWSEQPEYSPLGEEDSTYGSRSALWSGVGIDATLAGPTH